MGCFLCPVGFTFIRFPEALDTTGGYTARTRFSATQPWFLVLRLSISCRPPLHPSQEKDRGAEREVWTVTSRVKSYVSKLAVVSLNASHPIPSHQISKEKDQGPPKIGGEVCWAGRAKRSDTKWGAPEEKFGWESTSPGRALGRIVKFDGGPKGQCPQHLPHHPTCRISTLTPPQWGHFVQPSNAHHPGTLATSHPCSRPPPVPQHRQTIPISNIGGFGEVADPDNEPLPSQIIIFFPRRFVPLVIRTHPFIYV